MYAGFVGLYRFVVACLRVRWFLVGRAAAPSLLARCVAILSEGGSPMLLVQFVVMLCFHPSSFDLFLPFTISICLKTCFLVPLFVKKEPPKHFTICLKTCPIFI